jgi:signal transduction histidine kinase
MKEKSKIRISKTELAIVLLFSISSFIIYLGSFLISPEISPKYAMNFFVLLLGIIFVNIAIFPLLVHLSKENIKKAELMLIAQHIENQKNSVNIMEENYAEMRKLKHNIKTYVNNINLLISDGKIEKAAALGNSILSDKVLSDTDFDILNAVLNAKIKLAKSQNIDFSFLITDNISLLANTEINIVIMNLVDNAIEASKGVGGARVLLTIFKNKSYMNILVKNRIQTSVLSENPNLETTKKDSENHGFGIKSVKDIVNKFSGRVDFYEEDGYFCANVLVGSR